MNHEDWTQWKHSPQTKTYYEALRGMRLQASDTMMSQLAYASSTVGDQSDQALQNARALQENIAFVDNLLDASAEDIQSALAYGGSHE